MFIWLGLLCMGLFSTLFVLTLMRDAVLALGLASTMWGLWHARRTAQVVRVDIPIAGLPAALCGFTVAPGCAPGEIVVAGVADFSAHHFDEAHRSDPLVALSGTHRGRFASGKKSVGLPQSRDRLLGSAQALLRALRDHTVASDQPT